MNLPDELVAELPDALAGSLKLDCFAPVTGDARNLGARFGVHVVAYRPEHRLAAPDKVELCRALVMAELDESQLEELRLAENRLGVTLVAYARPIQLR